MPKNEDLSPRQKRSLQRLIWDFIRSTVLFWVPALIFFSLANEIRSAEPLPGEVSILTFIHTFTTSTITRIMEIITALGSAPFVAVGVTIAAATLWYLKRRRFALFLLFAAGGTVVINVILKLFFARERPDLWQHLVIEDGYSFPSGHAMISSALALAVITLAWRTKYRWHAIVFGILYTLLVSISRLYLGVHYPSDVIAGWCVSILWILTLHHVFARYERRRIETPSSKE
ncbi:MAG: acid phosphatase [Candidatus Saccharibacteria bacterium]|nr:acid phosphatase [Candidatus Saccharibacteria bacterium]